MFREIILPIFRSSRLCVTVCGIMDPRCCRPSAGIKRPDCVQTSVMWAYDAQGTNTKKDACAGVPVRVRTLFIPTCIRFDPKLLAVGGKVAANDKCRSG